MAVASNDVPSGPDDLTPRQAMEMYLDKRRTDATKRTQRFYQNRLLQFVQWCEANDIEYMRDLTGWDIETFEAKRRNDELAPTSMKAQMTALRLLLEYCEQLGAIDDGMHEKVSIPSITRSQESNDIRLDDEHAAHLLQHYRNTPSVYGTEEHVILEVTWHTGARIGGLRALDLDDFNPGRQYLDFRNRPETDTRLKNGYKGERAVAINENVCDALQLYIDRERWDKADEYGRQPLFCTRQGRASDSSIRAWCYLGTHPCVYRDCPHGENPKTCEYRERNHASKCPSARSPHQIRTGAITWMLNEGTPAEVVAGRVNASLAVIERHYDKAGRVERLDERRRDYTETLDIDTENSEQ